MDDFSLSGFLIHDARQLPNTHMATPKHTHGNSQTHGATNERVRSNYRTIPSTTVVCAASGRYTAPCLSGPHRAMVRERSVQSGM
jgi:hypothetical protein